MKSYLWWQTGVIYQIYPRSFQDASGDGIGDLCGIQSRLDYFVWLGIDAIWLSPIYPSPMADFGYDISNYIDIDPIFGTLADFDALLQATHERGLKFILDLVPNHTSDEHPWFVEARASHNNPRRNWYIWRDPAPDGGPPNNWVSHFGGPAWTFDPLTKQYYLHLFDPKQPDLNWRNPAVQDAIYQTMRFWFDRGVDGFRIDVIWMLIKDARFRDNLPNPDWRPGMPLGESQVRIYSEDQPEVHDLIRAMRTLTNTYAERVLIGEIYLPIERLVTYYGPDLDEVHLPFNFTLPLLTSWNAATIRQTIEDYEAVLPTDGWPNWVLGNHDLKRIATRIGLDQARVAQMLLLTLRGTPTCYYGDELGMQNVTVPEHLIQDPPAKRSGPEAGRDPVRSPMQWDAGPNAGFATPGTIPWLPLTDDYITRNVAAQRDDPTSMLSLVRQLLTLRRTHTALSVGAYQTVQLDNPAVLVYLRTTEDEQLLIALNFNDHPQSLDLPASYTNATLLCTTFMDQTDQTDQTNNVDLQTLTLRPHEGSLLKLA